MITARSRLGRDLPILTARLPVPDAGPHDPEGEPPEPVQVLTAEMDAVEYEVRVDVERQEVAGVVPEELQTLFGLVVQHGTRQVHRHPADAAGEELRLDVVLKVDRAADQLARLDRLGPAACERP